MTDKATLQLQPQYIYEYSVKHRHASLCTRITGGSTCLAVVMVMLFAFVRACQARFVAKAAELLGHCAVAIHGVPSHGADGCTVHIQGNATRHHLHISLFEAFGKACITCHRASIASVNAALISVRGTHDQFLGVHPFKA